MTTRAAAAGGGPLRGPRGGWARGSSMDGRQANRQRAGNAGRSLHGRVLRGHDVLSRERTHLVRACVESVITIRPKRRRALGGGDDARKSVLPTAVVWSSRRE